MKNPGIFKRQLKLKTPLLSRGFFLILIIILLYFWERYIIVNNIPKYILPKPTDIGIYLYKEIFLSHRVGYEGIIIKSLYSFRDALIGFFISALMGSFLGILFSRFKIFKLVFYPLLFVSQLLPIPAFAPIIAAIFGFDIRTKIIIIVLFTIFPVIVNIEKTVNNIKRNYVSLFLIINAGKIETAVKLYLPSIVPSLLLNLKIISTASFVASIVSELSLTISQGIGKDIYTSFNNQIIPRVWASLLVISIISISFYGFFAKLESYISKKYHYGSFE